MNGLCDHLLRDKLGEGPVFGKCMSSNRRFCNTGMSKRFSLVVVNTMIANVSALANKPYFCAVTKLTKIILVCNSRLGNPARLCRIKLAFIEVPYKKLVIIGYVFYCFCRTVCKCDLSALNYTSIIRYFLFWIRRKYIIIINIVRSVVA